jgi:putative transposase
MSHTSSSVEPVRKTVTRSRRAAENLPFSDEQIDSLLTTMDSPAETWDFLNDLNRRVIERVLNAEMTEHLGHEHGDTPVPGATNVRNGVTQKTIQTEQREFTIDVPRDRDSTFEPVLVPKRVRKLGKIHDMILSLYARGLSTRDITAHLEEVYGAKVSPATVSNITDVVVEEVTAWQHRPLDAIYPIVFIDAIHLKIRDGGTVINKACHIAVGVDLEGKKHVLGMWIAQKEGAKFWANVLATLKNRGLEDILILCCDGLSGLPEAVASIFPTTTVQTCVVHLLRTAMKYASYKERAAMARDMKPIYTAPSEDAAAAALDMFANAWEGKAPGAVQAWRRAWNEFVPFLAFPQPIRKVIYTTNQIESINYQLRKISKARGHFPNDEAAIKLLYLGVRNLSPTRTGELGTGTRGWAEALNVFAIHFEGRFEV